MKLPAWIAALAPALATCQSEPARDMSPATPPAIPAGAEVATLGAGCFWCVEAIYKQLEGVHSVTSGYMGGHVENPTYEQVCGKQTGHAEVVQVVFDPKKIAFSGILDWFWKLHDPTTLNRQGNDVGPQYRSVIFWHSPAQKQSAEASKSASQAGFAKPIVTEITAASQFWPAERYHQDYYFLNKDRNPYCRAVITPKLRKLSLDH